MKYNRLCDHGPLTESTYLFLYVADKVLVHVAEEGMMGVGQMMCHLVAHLLTAVVHP